MMNEIVQTKDVQKPEGEGKETPTIDVETTMKKNEERYNDAKGRLELMKGKLKSISIDTNASDECTKKAVTLYEQVRCKLEEIAKMIFALEVAYIAEKKVELTAIDVCKKGKYMPKHCWDWIQHVYHKAGVRRKLVYKDLKYEGIDCGKHHASPAMMDKISAGDLIFYNNKNSSDVKGNHSVIFLGWIDHEKGIAQVASGFKDHPGRIHQANLKENPVTFIAKPTLPKKQQEMVAQNMDNETQKIAKELSGIEELISQIRDQQQLASLEQKIKS